MKTFKLQSSVEELLYLSNFIDPKLINGSYYSKNFVAIHFAASGELIASDGHVLCRMERAWTYGLPAFKEPTDEEKIPANGLTVFVDDAIIKQLKLLPCPGPVSIEIDYNDQRPAEECEVRIASGSMTIKTHLQEQFALYENVMPKGDPEGSVVGLSPALLNKFTGWSKLTKQKSKDLVQLQLHGDNGPMLVKVSSNNRITGLLMPVNPDTFK